MLSHILFWDTGNYLGYVSFLSQRQNFKVFGLPYFVLVDKCDLFACLWLGNKVGGPSVHGI